jgi:hypothetical protein
MPKMEKKISNYKTQVSDQKQELVGKQDFPTRLVDLATQKHGWVWLPMVQDGYPQVHPRHKVPMVGYGYPWLVVASYLNTGTNG